jgi:hypothetical protein
MCGIKLQVCFVCLICQSQLLYPVQQECTNIFSSGGGQSLANISGIPFLGCVPIDPRVGQSAEKEQSFVATIPDSPVTAVFKDMVKILTGPTDGAGGGTAES